MLIKISSFAKKILIAIGAGILCVGVTLLGIKCANSCSKSKKQKTTQQTEFKEQETQTQKQAKIQAATQTNFINKQKPIGLNNSGNLCYFNSIIQQMYNNEDIRNQILNADFSNNKNGKDIQNIMKEIENHKNRNSEKKSFSIEEYAKNYYKGKQEDASEKLIEVLNDLGLSSSYTIWNCLANGNKKTLKLEESIQNSKDENCLNIYSSSDSKFFNTLICKIERLNYNNGRRKTSNKLNISENITLQEENNNVNYQLKGIVVHNGNSKRGHYFSYVKNSNNNWYCANDSKVSKALTFEKVKQETLKNSDMLFFEPVSRDQGIQAEQSLNNKAMQKEPISLDQEIQTLPIPEASSLTQDSSCIFLVKCEPSTNVNKTNEAFKCEV